MRRFWTHLLSLGLAVTLGWTAWGQQAPEPFVSRADGFSIRPPSGWKRDTSNPAVSVVFRGPVEDKFTPYVAVIMDSANIGLPFQDYMQMHKAQCERETKNFKVVPAGKDDDKAERGKGESKGGKESGGGKGERGNQARGRDDDRGVTLHVEYEQDGRTLRAMQHIERTNRGYAVISCVAPKDYFQKHENGFERCLDSFRVEPIQQHGKHGKGKGKR
ncbi:MAG: hypothetical protein FJ279_23635 [Planctomycetes bacterium]|nr:hypothetical protein [Planctomycetota bacterium]MBM4081287.1 hypothetical protein [Planctomycetota bacterium]